jgi:hypothetical protein
MKAARSPRTVCGTHEAWEAQVFSESKFRNTRAYAREAKVSPEIVSQRR